MPPVVAVIFQKRMSKNNTNSDKSKRNLAESETCCALSHLQVDGDGVAVRRCGLDRVVALPARRLHNTIDYLGSVY